MNFDFSKMLFLDIETVSQQKSYDELDEHMRSLWDKKAALLGKNDPEIFLQK